MGYIFIHAKGVKKCIVYIVMALGEWGMKLEKLAAAVALVTTFGSAPTVANATTLTFAATHNQQMNYVGEATSNNNNFIPINFNFTVSFDPQVTWALSPSTSYYSYQDTFGNNVNNVATYANTSYGQPTFSESPVSATTGIQYSQNPNLSNYSASFANSSYEHFDSTNSSYGCGVTPIGFSMNYQGIASPETQDYAFYVFELATYIPPDPTSAGDVKNFSSDTFLTFLALARDQKLVWNINEGGQYYAGSDISLRTGSHYFGSASLISIDGVPSPVPAPPAALLMLTGLGVLGLTKRFRKADKEA